ncbi:hypothetical protein LguiB_004379 [Lonicera macranthoides]
MESSDLSRSRLNGHLGVNKIGKNIKNSPLHQPNFTNTAARQQPQPQYDASNIKKQLVSEFLPDDMCPQGLQSFMDAPENIYQCHSNESKVVAEAAPPLLIEDDETYAKQVNCTIGNRDT